MKYGRIKTIASKALMGLPLAIAVSSVSAELSFQELPVAPAQNASLKSIDVSNDGTVAFFNETNYYKWSAVDGIQNIGDRDTNSYPVNSVAHISDDGETILFTASFNSNVATVFTTNGLIQFEPADGFFAFSLSPDGNKLGGRDSNGSASYNLASGAIQSVPGIQINSFDQSGNTALSVTTPPAGNNNPYTSAGFAISDENGNSTPIFDDLPEKALWWWQPGLTGNGQSIVTEGHNSTCPNNEYLCPIIFDIATGTKTYLPSHNSSNIAFRPVSTNSNASIIVSETDIWDAVNGVRDFKDMLSSKGIDVSNFTDFDNLSISPNGSHIVGTAIDENGVKKAFIVTDVPVCSSGFH